MKIAVRLGIVVVSAAVLQQGVFAQLVVAGAVVDLLVVVALDGGLAAGQQAGAVTGFFAGLALDLLSASGPLGLWAMTLALAGFVIGAGAPAVERSNRWRPAGLAAVGAVGATLLYVVLARLVDGRDLVDADLWPVLAVSAVGSALLILPALRVLRWVWETQPDVAIRLR